VLAVARLCGAEVAIVGLEADKHRLNIAKHYGCDVIIGDATGWARQRDGLGADCVIDAAGVSATLKIANGSCPAKWPDYQGRVGPQPLGFSLTNSFRRTLYATGKFQSQLAGMGTSNCSGWQAANST